MNKPVLRRLVTCLKTLDNPITRGSLITMDGVGKHDRCIARFLVIATLVMINGCKIAEKGRFMPRVGRLFSGSHGTSAPQIRPPTAGPIRPLNGSYVGQNPAQDHRYHWGRNERHDPQSGIVLQEPDTSDFSPPGNVQHSDNQTNLPHRGGPQGFLLGFRISGLVDEPRPARLPVEIAPPVKSRQNLDQERQIELLPTPLGVPSDEPPDPDFAPSPVRPIAQLVPLQDTPTERSAAESGQIGSEPRIEVLPAPAKPRTPKGSQGTMEADQPLKFAVPENSDDFQESPSDSKVTDAPPSKRQPSNKDRPTRLPLPYRSDEIDNAIRPEDFSKANDLAPESLDTLAPAFKPDNTATNFDQHHQTLLKFGRTRQMTLTETIHMAIANAPRVAVLKTDVGIGEAEIVRQQAQYDWTTFVEANWDDANIPGNAGETLGAVDDLLQHEWSHSLGVRRLNQLGGNIDIGQKIGYEDSNSDAFIPSNQGNAEISLVYEQPLLRGGGAFVNRSFIQIAVNDAQIARETLLAGLQDYLLQVVQAYWDLASSRGRLVTLRRSYERAAAVGQVVQGRLNIDVGPLQKSRSDATIAERWGQLVRAEYDVVLAQEQLLQLVLGAQFNQHLNTEIIPATPVLGPSIPIEISSQVQLALRHRAEIRQAMTEIRKASTEQGVAKNDLLPLLGMTLSVSSQGIRGDYNGSGAVRDQLTFENPTYGFGLIYEFPIGNRAARSNYRQAELRVRRFQKQFEEIVAEVALETRNATHNAVASDQERKAKRKAMQLAETELKMVQNRVEQLVDGDEVGPLYLDNLLQTQQRLEDAELSYLDASIRYVLSQYELQRATGTMLRANNL